MYMGTIANEWVCNWNNLLQFRKVPTCLSKTTWFMNEKWNEWHVYHVSYLIPMFYAFISICGLQFKWLFSKTTIKFLSWVPKKINLVCGWFIVSALCCCQIPTWIVVASIKDMKCSSAISKGWENSDFTTLRFSREIWVEVASCYIRIFFFYDGVCGNNRGVSEERSCSVVHRHGKQLVRCTNCCWGGVVL